MEGECGVGGECSGGRSKKNVLEKDVLEECGGGGGSRMTMWWWIK